jgi:hypothetical protein
MTELQEAELQETELQNTISNPVINPQSEYCRRFLRMKNLLPAQSEWYSAETDVSTLSNIYDLIPHSNIYKAKKNYEVEEKLEEALCAYSFTPQDEFKLPVSINYEKYASNLLLLRSSKAYAVASTGPLIDKLTKTWINFIIGLTWFPIDTDRIHRSLTFDLTSSDSVEDFLRIEPLVEIAEIQLTIPYVTDPMPNFNRILSSASAQKNISFDQAPKFVSLDFEVEE